MSGREGEAEEEKCPDIENGNCLFVIGLMEFGELRWIVDDICKTSKHSHQCPVYDKKEEFKAIERLMVLHTICALTERVSQSPPTS